MGLVMATLRSLCACNSFSGSHVLPVSSQPGSEISVHIPKQRLGLVKRGSLVEESLSPRFLQVQQSDTFTVAEDRDFVVVSMPATLLLQDQVSVLRVPPCYSLRGLLLELQLEPEVRNAESRPSGMTGRCLSVQILEVQLGFEGGPSGDSHRAWVPLVTCNQCPAALQLCQEVRESPGTQAFYRVDLSLDFAEMDSPVHWTVENFFQCAGK